MLEPTCQYCGGVSDLVRGAALYPWLPKVKNTPFWACDYCDAHVGCHKGTTTPLGTLAKPSLRAWRRKAHEAFDPLWKSGGSSTRSEAYLWLRGVLCLSEGAGHIAMLDKKQCKALISYAEAKQKE